MNQKSSRPLLFISVIVVDSIQRRIQVRRIAKVHNNSAIGKNTPPIRFHFMKGRAYLIFFFAIQGHR
ncbi:hypothetical protein HYC85_013530 [Camellia sinensis]|uniref:Uncharacterized protein n=1 Tax=Camellia sinensis TaxID=4442 RepID=A0A7J7H3L2_CAMSI|nr:hypothetical protein HYC85_013530 [Camellia sinensis]